MMGGFLSAIVFGIGQGNWNGNISPVLIVPARTNLSQGAFQLLGMAFSLGIGLLAGLFIGIFYKIFNRHDAKDQFEDAAHFDLE